MRVSALRFLAPCFVASVGHASDQPLFRVTLLENPATGVAPQALALGDNGVAVGSFLNTQSSYFDGLVWDPSGSVTVMSDEYGFVEAGPAGVLPDGSLVGSASSDPLETSHGIVIDAEGVVTTLPSLAGDTGVVSIVFGKNASGLCVGRSAIVPWPVWIQVANDAVIWEDGAITSLGTLGGFFAQATGVNDAGLVIGDSNTAESDFARGFVWDEVGGMREIAAGEPGGTGHVHDLDQNGTIVGRVSGSNGSEACTWAGPDADPVLLPKPFPTAQSQALALNEWGDVVGVAFTASEQRAVLWTDGEVLDLNDRLSEPSSLNFGQALDVNESGRILVASTFDAQLGFVYAVLSPLLFAQPASVSSTAGGAQDLALDAGPDHAGEGYFVLGSLSGTSPGVSFGASTLPLEPDAYFLFTASNPNAFPLQDTLGVFDPQGRANASIAIPAGVLDDLPGLVLHHAYVAFDLGSGQVTFASHAEPLTIAP